MHHPLFPPTLTLGILVSQGSLSPDLSSSTRHQVEGERRREIISYSCSKSLAAFNKRKCGACRGTSWIVIGKMFRVRREPKLSLCSSAIEMFKRCAGFPGFPNFAEK